MIDVRVATAWVALGFLALLELVLLWLIVSGKINLNRLISEPTGDASMSRFQFLIFTFVIAVSLFLVIAAPGTPAFPSEIPSGVLTLLGISGSTYLVSKGIQFSSPNGVADRPPRVTVDPKTVKLAAKQQQRFTAMMERGEDQRIVWSIDSSPVVGAITPDGLYTAPENVDGKIKVVIKAASVADCRATGYADVTF